MIDAKRVIETAITRGNCPISDLHISKADWDCNSFSDCHECANRIMEIFIEQNNDRD